MAFISRARGARGADGTNGANGAPGAKGDKGDKGDLGLTWRGDHAMGTTYVTGDAVFSNGSSFVALRGSTGVLPSQATPPVTSADWAVLARRGDTGPAGADGADGEGGGATPPPEATYLNAISVGDRQSSITITATGTWHRNGALSMLVNGAVTNDNIGLNASSYTNGNTIVAFFNGQSKIVTEVRLQHGSQFTGVKAHGTWVAEGSNDGAAWTIISDAPTNVLAVNASVIPCSGNTTAYKLVRLRQTAGSVDGDDYFWEIEFKAADATQGFADTGWIDVPGVTPSHPGEAAKTPQYRKLNGVVHFRGLVTNPVFTMPAGFRPVGDVYAPIIASAGGGSVKITNGGVCSLNNGSGTWYSLGGLTYPADY